MAVDPFNEELHGLRIYGWVQAYLEVRGWKRTEGTQWYSNPGFDESGQNVTIGHALEIQLQDDGLDLDVAAGAWPPTKEERNG